MPRHPVRRRAVGHWIIGNASVVWVGMFVGCSVSCHNVILLYYYLSLSHIKVSEIKKINPGRLPAPFTTS